MLGNNRDNVPILKNCLKGGEISFLPHLSSIKWQKENM